MVTEFPSSIGRQQQQQQQQELHNEESGKAKQTIVFDTKGINRANDKDSISKSNITCAIAATVATAEDDCTEQCIRKSKLEEGSRSTSDDCSAKLLCDIEARKSPIRRQDRNATATATAVALQQTTSHLLIDSRSILNNKQRLKRFWELKMELEFKLRQQQVEPVRSASKRSLAQQQAQPTNNNNKQVNYDANNNNTSNGDNKSANNDHTTTNENVNNIKQQLYYSDEEWRSLSPNLEPSSRSFKVDSNATANKARNGNSNNNNNNRSTPNKQQVSAELVCEKLREYQALNVNGQHLNSSSPASQQHSSTSNGENKPVPKNNASVSGRHINLNGQHSEEAQLMSIDPSICHSGATDELEKKVQSSSVPVANNNGNLADNDIDSNGNSNSNSFNEREEQTFNEEFSSSNSSFGPMSLSIANRQDVPGSDVSQVTSIAKSCLSDEEETNSAQSGSVLTVIMKLDHDNNNTNGDKSHNLNGCHDNDDDSFTVVEGDLRSQELSTLASSNNYDQVDEEKALNNNNIGCLAQESDIQTDEEAESNSNIGVAFESLHFDSEIKSSKHEQVDEELLRPTPVKRPSVSKFNASEVKSVCSFITAAISDATRQVESYMSKGNSNIARAQPTKQQEDPIPVASNEEAQVESLAEMESHNSTFSIQRATFVQESDSPASSHAESSTCRQQVADLATLQVEEEEVSLADSDKVPSADLSSIFEANVRREIEKFETHSVVKKSLGGKLANKNALTEWRIAEEIRLFNEREMELKRRFIGKNQSLADSSSSLNQQQANNETINGKSTPKQQESIVVSRFGKTLQLPKSESPGGCNAQLSKSIKLSTSATSSSATNSNGNNQPSTTMISMHKFIASGGKRFVFTNSPANNTNGTNTSNGSLNSLHLNQQLTKSMSNLSTNRHSEPTRPVDYKAADSFKCKETPNVRLGLTRKVIETFSKMSHGSQRDHHVSESQTLCTGSTTVRQLAHQQSNNLSQQVSPSAEWKIQEELREMRAREAELRSQRIHLVKQNSQVASPKNGSAITNGNGREVKDSLNGELEVKGENLTSNDPQIQAQRDDGVDQKLIDRLSFSSESLYPIKQTIDSFRKLNSSSQANNTSTPLQLNGNTTEIQKKLLAERQCNNDNYDLRVGGQRRKIPMIERWENNKLH